MRNSLCRPLTGEAERRRLLCFQSSSICTYPCCGPPSFITPSLMSWLLRFLLKLVWTHSNNFYNTSTKAWVNYIASRLLLLFSILPINITSWICHILFHLKQLLLGAYMFQSKLQRIGTQSIWNNIWKCPVPSSSLIKEVLQRIAKFVNIYNTITKYICIVIEYLEFVIFSCSNSHISSVHPSVKWTYQHLRFWQQIYDCLVKFVQLTTQGSETYRRYWGLDLPLKYTHQFT